MAKLRSFICLLIVALLALALIEAASAQKRQRQRAKPGGNGNQMEFNRNKNKKNPQNQGNGHKNKGNKGNKGKPNADPNVIVTSVAKLGSLRARTFTSEWTGQTIMQFLDVPYGKVTGRFKPAVMAEPWKKVLPSHRHHEGCPSIQSIEQFSKMEENGVDVEDCLRLTISTKGLEGNPAPVIVYIHGDFFYEGDTMEAAPGYLLEQDVVLVSVRYRLGPFGFLSTMTEDIPGNMAVTDIILALKWIQEHISGFGGDPKQVTLLGQVGGAALVNVLTMSPLVPEGLFHRVIYQSGTALSPAMITDSPLAGTKEIARIAGCKQVNKMEALHKCLNRMNTTMLLAAFSVHAENKFALNGGGGALSGTQLVIGGPSGILPDHPGRLLAAEKFKAYPTLGGSVKHGGTFMLRNIFVEVFNDTIQDDNMTGEQYIKLIIDQANGNDPTGTWYDFAMEEIFSPEDVKNGSFKRLTPGLIDLCSTISQKNPVLLVMQANAKKLPKSTYLYSFDYEGDLNRYANTEEDSLNLPFDLGVTLTDDNLYLYPWPRFNRLHSSRDIKMAKRLVKLWTSFAATGVPSAPNMPAWPAMTDETGPFLRLGRTVSIGENFLDEYSIAVREAKEGYSLVNDDYYVLQSALLKSSDESENETGAGDEADEDEGDADEAADNEARQQNLVFIAKKSNRRRA